MIFDFEKKKLIYIKINNLYIKIKFLERHHLKDLYYNYIT
jgi:hypothetical protein